MLESYLRFWHGDSSIDSGDYCPSSPMAWFSPMEVSHLDCNEQGSCCCRGYRVIKPESNRAAMFQTLSVRTARSISLLELALWKTKINGCKAAFDTDHERDKERSPKRPIFLNKSHLNRVDRQSCRINSGAEIVISRVLPFLDKASLPR
jgi:hypothetical protein